MPPLSHICDDMFFKENITVTDVNKQLLLFFETTHLHVPSKHPPVPATTGV